MTELQKWADCLPARKAIEDFFEWLREQDHGETEVSALHVSSLLDQYQEIDRRKLDDERRELLENHRKAMESQPRRARKP